MNRLLLSVLVILTACRGEAPEAESGAAWSGDATWRRVLTIGETDGSEETTFGRIVSLAVTGDGRMLVVDRSVPTVRVFASDGSYLDSWGRAGQGPGELKRPDAGIAVLADGRVVIRDPGNARLQIYSGDGEALDTWPVITGQYINRRAFGVTGDTLVNPDVVNPADPLPEWRLGLVRILSDGTVLDTVPIPGADRRAHRFMARAGGNTAEIDLPFAASEHWAWHPDGYVMHGVGDEYSVTLYRGREPLRIERATEPVEVTPEERKQEEQRVLNAMRWLDRGWDWDGPRIPDTKPLFSGLLTGTDGRIWILRDGAAYEVEDPDYDPTDPYDTEIRWRQEQALDTFEPDGTFLGTVVLPRDLDWRVPPVLRADTMWAVTRDEIGVQRVVRFELAFESQSVGDSLREHLPPGAGAPGRVDSSGPAEGWINPARGGLDHDSGDADLVSRLVHPDQPGDPVRLVARAGIRRRLDAGHAPKVVRPQRRGLRRRPLQGAGVL